MSDDKTGTVLPNAGSVILCGVVVPLTSVEGQNFITDCSRNAEGILPDQALMRSYDLDKDSWAQLAADEQLRKAVHEESEKRRFNGAAVRDAARFYHMKMPGILDKIARDEKNPASTRVAAIKETRDTAAVSDQAQSGSERPFIINISFGQHRVHQLVADPQPLLDSEPIEAPRPDEANA